VTGPSPLITLNNGVRMPALGLGVFRSPPEETAGAVEAAIASGYRLIDTAAMYDNERQVGTGIARTGIPRSDIFVTTKVWMSDYGYGRTLRAFDTSLDKLGLDQLDLYLLHWPVPTDFEPTIASYRAAEKLLADGRVRAIGVSNFSPAHLDRLRERTGVVPAVNQVELHPFFTQQPVCDANERLDIVTQAWSPIGGVYHRFPDAAPGAVKHPLAHPVVIEIAATHGKTPAQVVLSWHLARGRSAIPKSVHPERIAENIAIFDVALGDDELAAIDRLDTGARAGVDPELASVSTLPVNSTPAYFGEAPPARRDPSSD
jgi:diketogulonate reductase-like aldo/keto reductase